MKKIKILHVISSLEMGGAEITLSKLLLHRDASFEEGVVVLRKIGSIGQQLQLKGIKIYNLKMRHSYDFILAYVRLVKILKQERIDILQTWMYHADFMGALAKLLYGRFKLIWTSCHGDVSMSPLKRKTYFIAKICGHFSDRWPDKIICCSEATKKSHMKFGYAANKMCVVPNGFDVSLFKIDKAAGEKIRAELGLSDDHFIIGHAGRFHPVKDHFTFIQTAALVARQYKNVRFICCGTNIDWDNVELKAWIDKEGIRGFFCLLGERFDMPEIFNACDLFVSSSIVEGFSNVIGEAMACGLICVATDNGNAKALINNPSLIVPVKNAKLLADAILYVLNKSTGQRCLLGEKNREQIVTLYSVAEMVVQYEQLYVGLVN